MHHNNEYISIEKPQEKLFRDKEYLISLDFLLVLKSIKIQIQQKRWFSSIDPLLFLELCLNLFYSSLLLMFKIHEINKVVYISFDKFILEQRN